MTWSDGGRLLSRERAERATGGDPERMRMLGWGDAPADVPLAMLDPMGPRGQGAVACHYHPLRWAEVEAELADIVDEFQVAVPRAVTREDYASRSNFEIEALAAMAQAHGREKKRQGRSEQRSFLRALGRLEQGASGEEGEAT